VTEEQSQSGAGLTCQELVELVTDYLEGAMSADERARFEAHVGDCAACGFYVDQMRVTVRAVGCLRAPDLDPAARDELLAAFRTWKRAG
jgi:anti-sigma factor RsiW